MSKRKNNGVLADATVQLQIRQENSNIITTKLSNNKTEQKYETELLLCTAFFSRVVCSATSVRTCSKAAATSALTSC